MDGGCWMPGPSNRNAVPPTAQGWREERAPILGKPAPLSPNHNVVPALPGYATPPLGGGTALRFGIIVMLPKVALPSVGQPWAVDASPLAKINARL